MVPVAEPNGWARTSAHINEKREDDETGDCDDLDRSEDEFCFTIDADGEDVEAKNQNDDYGNPRRGCDAVIPVADEFSSSRDFDSLSDTPDVPWKLISMEGRV